jgi:hypothetical protein
MPKPFHRLSIDDFTTLISRFRAEPGRRRIDAVHMHHTWKPDHATFRQYQGGREVLVIESMYEYHTGTKGWSDIAQHVTIDPDGGIWTGRNLNQPPASAAGHNGNRMSGPFMFEMIGNFDQKHDVLEGAQYDAALHVIALVQLFFDLPPESLRFHNSMSGKTCPGNSIDRDETLKQVITLREKLASQVQSLRSPNNTRGGSHPFGVEADEIQEIFETVVRNTPVEDDPMDADPDHETMFDKSGIANRAFSTDNARRELGAEQALDVDLLHTLRPHVINLKQGSFSEDGLFTTSKEDVDAIFDEHLPKWLNAQDGDRPKRVLFYAHGGLVDEASGLRIAANMINWWKQNNIYPIYFVWETGFLQTLGQILRETREGVETRNFFSDNLFDPIVETAARKLGGEKIWSAMKFSAERSVDPLDSKGKVRGGAYYAAQRLKQLCDADEKIELHAVGHSAGAIFQSHFIPTAVRMGVPAFSTLHLLAPAVRVDAFRDRLMPLLLAKKSGIDRVSIFTMTKDYELADNTGTVYRKSLLYLIHYALERDQRAPILGLEISLRADPDIRSLFGLVGNQKSPHDVVWAVTSASTGTSASQSRSHGGFDNDRPTMESVMRRVLGVDDSTSIAPFPDAATRAFGVNEMEREMFGRINADAFLGRDSGDNSELGDALLGHKTLARLKLSLPTSLPSTETAETAPTAQAHVPLMSNGSPNLRALCVGINEYSVAPLRGCVADAQLWASTLRMLGFKTTVRSNKEGTYDAIVDQLGNLITSSRPGDVVVFQFAGHGTHLPDLNGDEKDKEDEAIVPFDFAGGRFLLDDDQWDIYKKIPEGVNVTSFYDCCHSGTMARVALASLFQQFRAASASDVRFRFMDPDDSMVRKHREFRSDMPLGSGKRLRDQESLRAVIFSACKDDEIALEKGGNGDFTLRATPLLLDAVRQGITHEEFQTRVTRAFGTGPAQNPSLDCNEILRTQRFLLPLRLNQSYDKSASRQGKAGKGSKRTDTASLGGPEVVAMLRLLADALEQRG